MSVERSALRLAVACISLAIVACGKRASTADRPLEVVVPTEAATLDPRFSTRALDIKITRLVHAGLVGLDANTLEPVPLVAKSWHFDDDRTLQLTLRPGLRFHSGQALSPRDVCATIEALKDKSLHSPHRAIVRAIGSCRVTGPLSLTITLAQARATLLTDLELPVLRADQASKPPSPEGALDGLGPFYIQAVQAGSVLLRPADTGVLPKPHHAVAIRTVRDENARALRLLAGRSDIAPNAISPALLPALDHRPGLTVVSRPGANVTYLLMQNDRAPLNRSEVRHALARAIDCTTIVRTLLSGRGQVASFIFPPGHWAHAPGLLPERFDPAGAKRVLSTLKPITLLTSTDRARVTIARAIAQMLGDAGLEVRVVSLDLGVMLERLDAGDYDIATLQMPELTEPHLLSWFFHPRGVPGEGGEGRNRARYRNPDAGRLLDQAGQTRDIPTRKRLYTQLAHLMQRDLPVAPLWHEDQIAVVSTRAQGFSLSAEGRWLALAGLP